jgi:MinD superfamily P-loop ATPase
MKSNKRCPFCQEKIIDIVESKPPAMQGYQYQCDNCGACGPIYENKEEALTGWEQGIRGIDGRMRKS